MLRPATMSLGARRHAAEHGTSQLRGLEGLPASLASTRSGISIVAKWSGRKSNRVCDAVGRYAAGLGRATSAALFLTVVRLHIAVACQGS